MTKAEKEWVKQREMLIKTMYEEFMRGHSFRQIGKMHYKTPTEVETILRDYMRERERKYRGK